jgi:hypothetical protein
VGHDPQQILSNDPKRSRFPLYVFVPASSLAPYYRWTLIGPRAVSRPRFPGFLLFLVLPNSKVCRIIISSQKRPLVSCSLLPWPRTLVPLPTGTAPPDPKALFPSFVSITPVGQSQKSGDACVQARAPDLIFLIFTATRPQPEFIISFFHQSFSLLPPYEEPNHCRYCHHPVPQCLPMASPRAASNSSLSLL